MIAYSTGVMVGMVCAIIALVILIAILADEVIRLRASETIVIEEDHNACIARIILEMGDRAVAHRIRLMADAYDTRGDLVVMRAAKEKWTAEGPVLPVLWLREHADLLDPPTDNYEYMMNGIPVLKDGAP